jgi:hypothetical protein
MLSRVTRLDATSRSWTAAEKVDRRSAPEAAVCPVTDLGGPTVTGFAPLMCAPDRLAPSTARWVPLRVSFAGEWLGRSRP